MPARRRCQRKCSNIVAVAARCELQTKLNKQERTNFWPGVSKTVRGERLRGNSSSMKNSARKSETRRAMFVGRESKNRSPPLCRIRRRVETFRSSSPAPKADLARRGEPSCDCGLRSATSGWNCQRFFFSLLQLEST